MARPRKADAERRSERVQFRVTKAEADALYRLARRHACTLATLLRVYVQRGRAEDARRVSVIPKPDQRTQGAIVEAISLSS